MFTNKQGQMKKIFTLSLAMVFTLMSYSQNLLEFYGTITDASGAPVGNHFVAVQDSLSGSIDTTLTSPNGFYYLSIAAGQVAMVELYSMDCNGSWMWFDTLLLVTPPGDTIYHDFTFCTNPPPNCVSNISASATTAGGNTFNFTSSHNFTPISYSWDFGDGTTSTAANPTYTYTQSGTFNVTLVATGSSLFGTMCSTISSTVVNVSVWNTNCDASFTIDTALSTTGNVVLWNTSTAPANNVVSYFWNFGDGGTSTQAFPTHTYANPGNYTLCLTMMTADPLTGDSCYDYHCDSLVIDSMGNLIYKGFAGFQLVVLDPIFLNMEDQELQLSLFPNPTKGSITLQHIGGTIDGTIEIFNALGQKVWSRTVLQAEADRVVLDISELKSGSYTLQYQTENRARMMPLIIQ